MMKALRMLLLMLLLFVSTIESATITLFETHGVADFVSRDDDPYEGSDGLVIHGGDHYHDPCNYVGRKFKTGRGEANGFVVVNDCQIITCTKWTTRAGNSGGRTVIYDIYEGEGENSDSVSWDIDVILDDDDDSDECVQVGKFAVGDDCDDPLTRKETIPCVDGQKPSVVGSARSIANMWGLPRWAIALIALAASILALLLCLCCCRKRNKDNKQVSTSRSIPKGADRYTPAAAGTAGAGMFGAFGRKKNNERATHSRGMDIEKADSKGFFGRDKSSKDKSSKDKSSKDQPNNGKPGKNKSRKDKSSKTVNSSPNEERKSGWFTTNADDDSSVGSKKSIWFGSENRYVEPVGVTGGATAGGLYFLRANSNKEKNSNKEESQSERGGLFRNNKKKTLPEQAPAKTRWLGGKKESKEKKSGWFGATEKQEEKASGWMGSSKKSGSTSKSDAPESTLTSWFGLGASSESVEVPLDGKAHHSKSGIFSGITSTKKESPLPAKKCSKKKEVARPLEWDEGIDLTCCG